MSAMIQSPPTLAAPRGLVQRLAERFGVDPTKMLATLKATAFRQRKADVEITNEQMMALLVVAEQYSLNPWTKEIFAFEDKGSIIPVVSVDGWSRIINEHPSMDGVEFRYSDETITLAGAKPSPAWCEAVFYRKDRQRPVVVREYLDEVYVPPRNNYSGPWQSHTKRMLRHKAFIQGGRVAIGFGGIYDEDEAHRIIDAESRVIHDAAPHQIAHDVTDLAGRVAAAAEATGKPRQTAARNVKPQPVAKNEPEPHDASDPAEDLPAELPLTDAPADPFADME